MSHLARMLIATRNKGKLREYQELLAGLPVELLSLDEAGIDFEVEETGQSFKENAVLKARNYAQVAGVCTLADDSGLEVDALGGEPGVLSSRYAGPAASDADRVRYLLDKLRGVPDVKRTARFKCVIAVVTPRGRAEISEGACEGTIALEPRGHHGFGYDPIFFVPELGQTMAEISPVVKNRISHRACAAIGARAIVERLLSTAECL